MARRRRRLHQCHPVRSDHLHGLPQRRGLKASGNRLRPRIRALDEGLRDAIPATSQTVLTKLPNHHADEAVCAVLLGKDDYGTPQ